MKNVRTTLVSSIISLCVGYLAFTAQPVAAQSMSEPAAVISITNLEETLKDVDYLVDASGFGQMKFMIQTQITHFLKGIDQARPAGVLLYMDEGATQPSAIGFLPVEELDDLLDTLAGFAEVDEGDDFTTIITDDGKEILIKQLGDHAFVTDKAEMFDRIPDVPPANHLGDLPARFNLAARIFGQRIPQALRDKAISTIRDAYEQQLEELEADEENSTQAQLQQKSFEMNMNQIEDLVQETDQLMIGMVVDQENKTISGEIEIIGTDGSTLAKRAAANMSPEKSLFSGFILPESVFNAVSRTNLIQEDIDQYTQLSKTGTDAILKAINEESDLAEEEFEVVKSAVYDLTEAFLETMKDGIADGGIVAELEKGNINFAVGVLTTDPAKFEQVAKNLAAEFEGKLSDFGTIKLNSGSRKDVTFHTFTMETPQDTEEAVDAFGDQIQVVIGVGRNATYLAAGSDPTQLLTRAIDGNEAETSPATLGQYNIYLAPIMDFAAQIQPEQPMVQPMADRLAEVGRDRLQYELKPLKNGFSVRMDLQDGFMELIQVATEALGQAQGAGQF